MKRSIFKLGGLALSVAETGEGADFVFQHGLCGAAGQPADVFPTDSGWRCLTLECRGHGQSQSGDPAKFSIAAFADDLAELIEARSLAPVVIGGISMGAAIALRLAVIRPQLVRGLVLARPAWVAEAAPPNAKPNAEVGELLRRHPPVEARGIFERSETAAKLTRDAPDNLASLRGFFAREPIAVTAELLTRVSADGPGVTRAAIGGIRVPTLIIGHDRDMIHPMAMAKELSGLIPQSKLVAIPPKADNLQGYRAGFQSALATFLKGF
ncbi:MAG: alpha/beta fold hydrolase [Aestuariivirga sp.]